MKCGMWWVDKVVSLVVRGCGGGLREGPPADLEPGVAAAAHSTAEHPVVVGLCGGRATVRSQQPAQQVTTNQPTNQPTIRC